MSTPAPARTVAFSVARFTLASATPGSAASARSTRPAQEAHVMPSTGKVHSRVVDAAGSTTELFMKPHSMGCSVFQGARQDGIPSRGDELRPLRQRGHTGRQI